MAGALPMVTRKAIIEGFQDGKSRNALAREFRVNYRTVQTLVARFEAEGLAGLKPRYDRCGATGPRRAKIYHRTAVYLKRLHPTWGAPLILLHLTQRYQERAAANQEPLPSVRTLQYWFKAAGLSKTRSKRPQAPKDWATQVHAVWQVDAKEHQRLADGTRACYLTITDEHSSAVLAAPVFPLCPDQSSTA